MKRRLRTVPADGARPGFTLVELAMTALLLSMGLLAVFALLRRGIESRIEMEAEVRSMLFADAVANTLQALSEQSEQDPEGAAWARFWFEFAAGGRSLALHPSADAGDDAADGPGGDADADTARLYGDGDTRHYRWRAAAGDPAGGRWADTALRYQCQVTLANTFGAEGYVLADYPTNRVQVTLHVWPEGAGDSAAQTYFMLFSNAGRLP